MVSFYQLAVISCAVVVPAALAQNVAPRQNFLDTVTTGTPTEGAFTILPVGPLPTPSGLLTETGSMSILPVDLTSTATSTSGVAITTGTTTGPGGSTIPAISTSTPAGAAGAVNANNGNAAAIVAIGGLIAGFAEYGFF